MSAQIYAFVLCIHVTVNMVYIYYIVCYGPTYRIMYTIYYGEWDSLRFTQLYRSTQHSTSRCGFRSELSKPVLAVQPACPLRPFPLSHWVNNCHTAKPRPMKWPGREISWALSILQVIVILASRGKSGCHRIKYYPLMVV